MNECNYVTQGNYDALGNTLICKKIMAHIGLNPERLRIEFMNASDGIFLAESINNFSKNVKTLGPLGQGEGIDQTALKRKLEAIRKLVPYLRLVERERLRVPTKSEQAYRDFFASEVVDKLFDELVFDKLAICQIMLLLRERPLSTAEISEMLDLNPSEVSKHLISSSRHGLVRYNESLKRFAHA